MLLATSGIDAAFTTTGTSFDAPLDTLTDMVSGAGGRLAAGAVLDGSVPRFDVVQLNWCALLAQHA